MKPGSRRGRVKALLRFMNMTSGSWRDERFPAEEAEELAPLRAELLSADQMVQYGKALAAQHEFAAKGKSGANWRGSGAVSPDRRHGEQSSPDRRHGKQDYLLLRLSENSRALKQAGEVLALAANHGASTENSVTPALGAGADLALAQDVAISPAAEWLLDNFYLIEEQMLTAKAHLPKGYSRELAPGPTAGIPRVYDLALAAISHSDGRLDLAVLERFVDAYQSVTPLSLGELWAIPIMLRLALIENLRRVAVRISSDRQYVMEANQWAAQMLGTAEHDPKNLIGVVADMARSNPPMVSAFVGELARRLRGHGPALALGLNWIEQRLAESSLTIEHLVWVGNQQQAGDQVSISNSIGSLRFIGATNWQLFVEGMSHVEQLLRQGQGETCRSGETCLPCRSGETCLPCRSGETCLPCRSGETCLPSRPAKTYAAMDFATRDRYRHVIDRLAKASAHSELSVTRAALALANAVVADTDLARTEVANADAGKAVADGAGGGDPKRHVGYYLIGPGLLQLEQALGARIRIRVRLTRMIARFPLLLHFGAAFALNLLFVAVMVRQACISGLSGAPLFALTALCFLAVSQLSLSLTNLFATLIAIPNLLPRMDFAQTNTTYPPCRLIGETRLPCRLIGETRLSCRLIGETYPSEIAQGAGAGAVPAPDASQKAGGIPKAMKTLVVVPTMLHVAGDVEVLLEALEVRYLGNQDAHLHFALLTDFSDAAQESLATDAPLLALARAGIEQLNNKYRNHSYLNSPLLRADRFFLLHRPRLWNPSEGRWMGYERKRGKLSALNALLRGTGRAYFSLIVGNLADLNDVKYIITLDTDTELPRDAAHQFVGAMAHPLNQPQFDAQKQRVVSGYGILQPRMAASLSGRSIYARLCSSEPGIDPYTRSVSDVYQDLYGEGSFIGKGIYDIDAFEQALNQRLPGNRILSHDLLEGCYARSGLLSDVHLYEQYPTSYIADMARLERWIRGDWQIACWSMWRVPTAKLGQVQANPLSLLSRGKIFDNLRRSLVPPALLLILLLGVGLMAQPWFWLLSVLMIMFLPSFLGSLLSATHWPALVSLRQHLREVARGATQSFALLGFRVATVPFEAAVSVGAVVRACWRMGVSHRQRLAWRTSSSLSQASGSIFASYQTLWPAPFAAFTLLGTSCLHTCGAAPVAASGRVAASLLLAGLWLAAPWLAWWLSQPTLVKPVNLSSEQQQFLRKTARKTWAYFARFVTAEEHYLPPDNFQVQPGPLLAHRTSPTNMGLALLANLSAYDFGFISQTEMLERSENTLNTMAKLPRFQGHFYNWYDTLTLATLAPRYISTVDSGNLAGHLVTLRCGLRELPDLAILSAEIAQGLRATLSVVVDATPASQRARFAPLVALLHQRDLATATPRAVAQLLQKLAALGQSLLPKLDESVFPPSARESVASAWPEALMRQILSAISEIEQLMPWLHHVLPVNAPDAKSIQDLLDSAQTLRAVAYLPAQIAPLIEIALSAPTSGVETAWLTAISGMVDRASACAVARISSAERMAQLSDELCAMDYEFLYDPARKLLAIGYNVDALARDTGFYDLLASEARLGYFIAIAFGQVPQESWFALGRLRTNVGGAPILMSWSGSMFEYLMPLLVMPSFNATLLEESCRAAVSRQIAFGLERGLPWGVSESGYSKLDANFNYQYHAFGVPGLGLKRGLAVDSVVAPYASALALMVLPVAACANLQRFAANGIGGDFGFFEAVDYTPMRIARGQSSVVVRSFMAHHQGMSLLSIAHLLLDQPMQRRFVSDLRVQATLLLLQERIPKNAIFHQRLNDPSAALTLDAQRRLSSPGIGAHTASPRVQLLSNGRYHVMLTNAGSGYSRWQGMPAVRVAKDGPDVPAAAALPTMSVSRWREDASCDHWGTFFYLRDQSTGEFWSATHQPTCRRADSYEAIFSEGRAEYHRRDFEIDCATEIVVSPEDDVEVRRITLSNRSTRTRTIELTSYQEVVLAPQIAELMQPAFSNLFVQTEIFPARRAIVCKRRPRSGGEASAWMFHLLATNGDAISQISYETDRMRFIGRAGTLTAPLALRARGQLSNTQGSVLDPIAAIRCSITLKPGQSATVDFVSGAGSMASSLDFVNASSLDFVNGAGATATSPPPTTAEAGVEDACTQLMARYQDRHHADRVFDLAWTHAGVSLRQLDVSEADAELYRRLSGHILYANALLRADSNVLRQNRRGQSGLWGYAISGDLPIMLLRIADSSNIALAQSVIQCHSYLRLKGLVFDLVIWNEDHAGYRQRLQDQIIGLIASGIDAHVIDRPGGIFVRQGEQISAEDRILLQAVARVIIDDTLGTLAEQINRRPATRARVARLHRDVLAAKPARTRTPTTPAPLQALKPEPSAGAINQAGKPGEGNSNLLFDNGIGGFSRDGSEYVIVSHLTNVPPLPWVNVLANAQFGSVITERGMAYTWSENAHEFRLTPWSDDPIGASGGEAFYLRDEQSGQYWSAAPAPCHSVSPYTTRHGFGYSVFEHDQDGVHSELKVFVDLTEAIKFSVLTVRNRSGRARRLSATGYVEWVLGDLKAKTGIHICTELDLSSGAVFARNRYNTEFSGRLAFFDADETSSASYLPTSPTSGELTRTMTGDRSEFIGRNGSLGRPAAMSRAWLAGRFGAALDACGAIQVPFVLADGGERQIVFRLGAATNVEQARALNLRLRKSGSARAALANVERFWQQRLSAVQVQTPDPAFDVLANGWLVYQTLVARYWARSGYYQSGGAYGFRDQLQDVMALVHVEPSLVRAHLLRAAARQYPEGDVQHWWHPPSGRGVRTRCSDDYLWLPLACCRFVSITGDASVLDETVTFISGRPLGPDEESYYDLPSASDTSGSLYLHCVRAIEHGLRFGVHGLPLMGSGDWNDGMNLVGIHGKGESVWLGFFLYQVLMDFAELSDARKDVAFAKRCRQIAQKLRRDIEANGWDGAWYRRAYFDDGTPLGSAVNSECSIDAIAQSWSVLSGAGAPARVQSAMNALDQRLVRRADKLVLQLDPPFDPELSAVSLPRDLPAVSLPRDLPAVSLPRDLRSARHPGYIAGYVPGVRENGGQYTHAAIWAAMAFAKMGDSKRAWELFDMINPVNHGNRPQAIAVYQAEPYVVAADVYASPEHTGRGGWSWYTGSAGWMYRLMLESLLGLSITGDRLTIKPCMPAGWNAYSIRYRFASTYYQIQVLRAPPEEMQANVDVRYTLDGVRVKTPWVQLLDDAREHTLGVMI